MTRANIMTVLDNWEETKKAFKAWGIKSYAVDPNLKELRIEEGALYILPEMETVVSELLKEITHEQQS